MASIPDLLARVDSLKAELDALRPLDRELEDRVLQKSRLWWTYHSNALSWSDLFDPIRGVRPMHPVAPYVRHLTALAAALGFAIAIALIATAIKAQVWEGASTSVSERSNSMTAIYFLAFSSLWLALVVLGHLWQDHARRIHGVAARRMDPAQREAISQAVEQMDFARAIRLYRDFIPEATLVEANDHVMLLAAEFRTAEPGKYVAAQPRLADLRFDVLFLGSLVVWGLLFAVLYLAHIPKPAQMAYYFACGFALAAIILLSARLRGIAVRFILFAVPTFALSFGGPYLFQPPPPGRLWLFFAGAAAGLPLMKIVTTPGPKSHA